MYVWIVMWRAPQDAPNEVVRYCASEVGAQAHIEDLAERYDRHFADTHYVVQRPLWP